MGPVRGGLAIGTVIICAIFAAMSGISATATVSMGIIALPAMIKRGYDKILAMGVISGVIKSLGFDPLWFGVLFIMNMEMGYLTPPFGFNLFYMKAIAPPGVTMGDIYRSIVPIVGLQAVALIIAMIFPEIALWFPRSLTR